MLAVRSFIAVTLLAAIGCATTPAADTSGAGSGAPAGDQAAAENTMAVTVANNRTDGGITTIYVEPNAGVRSAVGTIDQGSTRSFTFRFDGQSRNVRLIAINATGQQLQSEAITVPRGAGVFWDLQINSVRIRR